MVSKASEINVSWRSDPIEPSTRYGPGRLNSTSAVVASGSISTVASALPNVLNDGSARAVVSARAVSGSNRSLISASTSSMSMSPTTMTAALSGRYHRS